MSVIYYECFFTGTLNPVRGLFDIHPMALSCAQGHGHCSPSGFSAGVANRDGLNVLTAGEAGG